MAARRSRGKYARLLAGELAKQARAFGELAESLKEDGTPADSPTLRAALDVESRLCAATEAMERFACVLSE